MAGAIISGITFGFCGLLMIGIGIFQIKSKKPTAFYTGEKPPEERELTDVKAWNGQHGTMWILYGVSLLLDWLIGLFLGDSLLLLLPLIAGPLLPIPVMVAYHHRLVKQYRIR